MNQLNVALEESSPPPPGRCRRPGGGGAGGNPCSRIGPGWARYGAGERGYQTEGGGGPTGDRFVRVTGGELSDYRGDSGSDQNTDRGRGQS